MAISQFYILSTRGDKIIARDYRYDIVKGSEEIFFRKIKSMDSEGFPVFEVQGIQFVSLKKSNMYFVITTRNNVSAITYIQFLARISNLIRDFCGTLNEESVRQNFTLIYEILDEIIDNGFIQDCNTKLLKSFISNEPVELTEQRTVNSTAAARPIQGGQNKKSELFLDVLEKINVTFSSAGNVLNSEIVGSIIMKSFIPGDPLIKLGLTEGLVISSEENRPYGTVVLDYVKFSEYVDLREFEQSRVLSLYPPDGEFSVMDYRVSKEYNVPFRITPYVTKESQFKVKLLVTLRNELPATKQATNVVVRIPVPKDTATVSVEFGVGQQNSYEYNAADQVVLWGIKKFPGSLEQVIKINVVTNSAITYALSPQMGPVGMRFEIPMHNCSGLEVKYLKVVTPTSLATPKKSTEPSRYVRCITQAGSYLCRVNCD
ncbi:predicted protein [Naegleria gruberi]|uniref:Predicted protein n=1 Tax=Naegleria gruberi TaxID=5762 RepID=D2VKB5_NAEGR|nr:uncharacterized protein NAEGRDRAFT_60743 [Naegleria gruberi]EFC42571.1 predicted protein [Naegleria gruberi]|eukprot:XP_002675315.1 predicted protein [Naegleria gruberi strain NEG-M]